MGELRRALLASFHDEQQVKGTVRVRVQVKGRLRVRVGQPRDSLGLGEP